MYAGYLTLDFSNSRKKRFYHGFDKNESNRLYCYYHTNKDTGSEFLVSWPHLTFPALGCCFDFLQST